MKICEKKNAFMFVFVFFTLFQRIAEHAEFSLGTESSAASFGHVDIGQKEPDPMGKTTPHCNSSTYSGKW